MKTILAETDSGNALVHFSSSEKKFYSPTGLKDDSIKSVYVILEGKLKAVSPEKFWKYDSIINVLGTD